MKKVKSSSACRFKSVRIFRSPRGTSFLEGDCGYYTSITLYNRILINKPGLIMAYGDIPDELKIKDGISFSFTRCNPKDIAEHSAKCHCADLLMQGFNKTKEVLRSMEEEKYGLDDKDQQQEQQQEYKEDGQFKEDPSTSVKVTINHQGREGLFMKNEDMIAPKDIWVTFISRGGHRFLGRHVGLFFLISQYEGIIMNKPGVVVAAVGDIPNELKIEGGISFSFPAPIYKIPRSTKRFNVHEKSDYQFFEEFMGKEFCSKALRRAYSKAMGVSSICKDEESEDEEAYTDELFPTMILVNLATPQDIQHLDPSISPIASQSIPIKKEVKEEDVGAKRTFEDSEDARIHKKARLGSSLICKQEKE